MFGFLASFLWILLTGVASIGGFIAVKRFVRRRLRFVDALHKRHVPLISGLLAVIVASPFVAVLPILTGMSAVLFGAGVGAGVAAGRRELKRLPGA
ncbi:MAG: hypothetical protein ACE5HQ_06175 [Gemmatimonadota bacterium]